MYIYIYYNIYVYISICVYNEMSVVKGSVELFCNCDCFWLILQPLQTVTNVN